jgi:hypothetical protein
MSNIYVIGTDRPCDYGSATRYMLAQAVNSPRPCRRILFVHHAESQRTAINSLWFSQNFHELLRKIAARSTFEVPLRA